MTTTQSTPKITPNIPGKVLVRTPNCSPLTKTGPQKQSTAHTITINIYTHEREKRKIGREKEKIGTVLLILGVGVDMERELR